MIRYKARKVDFYMRWHLFAAMLRKRGAILSEFFASILESGERSEEKMRKSRVRLGLDVTHVDTTSYAPVISFSGK